MKSNTTRVREIHARVMSIEISDTQIEGALLKIGGKVSSMYYANRVERNEVDTW